MPNLEMENEYKGVTKGIAFKCGSCNLVRTVTIVLEDQNAGYVDDGTGINLAAFI